MAKKPTATEEMLKSLSVGSPVLGTKLFSATTPADISADPSRFAIALVVVGQCKLRVESGWTREIIARRVCNKNGMSMPRAKGAKTFLQSLSSQVLQDAHAVLATASVSVLIDHLGKLQRRQKTKQDRARRATCENQVRSGLKGWPFTLEEVTRMWHECEVEAVHES